MPNNLCIVWDVEKAQAMTSQPRTYGRASRIADVLEDAFGRAFVVIPARDAAISR